MTLVVDASVAVKWFFREPGHAKARALLDSGELLIAPSLLLIEVANAAWKRHRRGEVARDIVQEIVLLTAKPFSELVAIEALAPRAATLALDLDHPIYDCLYLALAAREGIHFITADQKLRALGKRAGVKVDTL